MEVRLFLIGECKPRVEYRARNIRTVDVEVAVDDDLSNKVEELIAKRLEAKKAKDWATADAIRNELTEMGIALKDTPQGTTWSKM